MSPNIPRNVARHSGECPQTFQGHSGECRQIFRGMSPNIPGNVAKYSGEFPRKIQRIFENSMWHAVKNYVKSMKGFA